MSPKPDVSVERSEQIIEAAMKVFSEKGFHQATMEDIAQQAGLSKGALYLYFKGKDKIISTLLRSFFEVEYAMIQDISLQDASCREVLEEVNHLVVKDLVRVKAFVPILFEFISMSFRNRNVQQVVRESLYHYIEILTPIIQEGVDRGELRRVDARDAALAYGSLLEGSILLWSYDMKAFDFEELVRGSMKIFLDGLEVQSQGG